MLGRASLILGRCLALSFIALKAMTSLYTLPVIMCVNLHVGLATPPRASYCLLASFGKSGEKTAKTSPLNACPFLAVEALVNPLIMTYFPALDNDLAPRWFGFFANIA